MNQLWLEWSSDGWRARLALTLLHLVWQGLAIGVFAAIIGMWLRTASATTRYGLYAAALAALPLVAALTYAGLDVPESWREPAAVQRQGENSVGERGQESTAPSATPLAVVADAPTEVEAFSPPASVALPTNPAASEGASGTRWPAQLASVVSIGYLAGVGGFLLRLLVAVWGGQRLRAASRPLRDRDLLAIIAAESRRIGLRAAPAVAFCERVAVPTVVGLLRPLVLLPPALICGLSAEQIAAVLSHELAHIRRADLWVNLLQRVIESLLFFHPVVWYLSRRLSAEREACCDDLVVSAGYQPMVYAGALLRMAELCVADKDASPIAVAAMGRDATQLEQRIVRLMSMTRQTPVRLTRVGVLLVGMLFVPVAALPAALHALNRHGFLVAGVTGAGEEAPPKEPTSPDENRAPQETAMQNDIANPAPAWLRDNLGEDPFVLDNQRMLLGSKLWDVNTGKQLGAFSLGERRPMTMRLSANRRYLLTVDVAPMTTPDLIPQPAVLQVWDTTTGKPVGSSVQVPPRLSLGGMQGIQVSSDGKWVVAVTTDNLARALPENGVTVTESGAVEQIRDTGGIIVWNMETGAQKRSPFAGPQSECAVAFSGDHQWLAAVGNEKLAVWKWRSEEQPRVIPTGRWNASLAFSVDGRFIVEGPGTDSDIRVRDLQTLKVVRTLQDAEGSPLRIRECSLQFNEDGTRLVAGNAIRMDAEDKLIPRRIHVWDFNSGKLLKRIDTRQWQVWSLDITPRGDKLAARLVDGPKSMVAVWSLEDDKVGAAPPPADGQRPGEPAPRKQRVDKRVERQVVGAWNSTGREGMTLVFAADHRFEIVFRYQNVRRQGTWRVNDDGAIVANYLFSDNSDWTWPVELQLEGPDVLSHRDGLIRTRYRRRLASDENDARSAPAAPDKPQREGVEFLGDDPQLADLSLGMTRSEFLETVKSREMVATADPDGKTYTLRLPAGGWLRVVFGAEGDRCSAILRVPNVEQIRDILAQQADIEFVRTTLSDAMAALAQQWGVPIVIDRESLKAAGLTVNQRINIAVSGISRKAALDLFLGQLGLTFKVQQGRLSIVAENPERPAGADGAEMPPWTGRVAQARMAQRRPAFGETRSGLRLGIALHGEGRPYRQGEWIAFEYFLENTGDSKCEIEFWPPTADGRVFEVRDKAGDAAKIGAAFVSFEQSPIHISLKPNEVIGAVEGFQAGDRTDGRVLGPHWVDPKAGKHTAVLPMVVTVRRSGQTKGAAVHLQSGAKPFEYAGAAAEIAVQKGLEFLAGYPELAELRLEMTHAEFMEIVSRRKLIAESTDAGSTYTMPTGDGHTVLVMFKGGQCSGIQRLRGEMERKQPLQGKPHRFVVQVDGPQGIMLRMNLFAKDEHGKGHPISKDVQAPFRAEFDAKSFYVEFSSNAAAGQPVGKIEGSYLKDGELQGGGFGGIIKEGHQQKFGLGDGLDAEEFKKALTPQ
ncbi:MAG: M48 family metalloprotease [Planctomycetales bacterium]|nr:M48 family metalloprotease [Planctomycetales bacterium]